MASHWGLPTGILPLTSYEHRKRSEAYEDFPSLGMLAHYSTVSSYSIVYPYSLVLIVEFRIKPSADPTTEDTISGYL
jgi:hypothetical protein